LNLLPIALGLVLALSFGTSDFLSKGLTARIGAYRTTVYVLALSGFGVLIPGLFLESSYEISPLFVVILLVIAVTTLLSFGFMYRAYNKGALSLTAPIVNVYPAVSLVISIVFLGVSLSVWAILALAVVITGIVLVSTSLSDLRSRFLAGSRVFVPGIGSAFFAAIFFGMSWTTFGFASQNFGYLLPAIAVRGGAALIGLVAAPILKQDFRPVGRKFLPRLLAIVLLEITGVVIFSLGVTIVPSPSTIPILATFGGMAAAVTVAFAVTLLKEKLESNHVVGVTLLIAGVGALLFLTA
jgi:uncharacterized membrane protein